MSLSYSSIDISLDRDTGKISLIRDKCYDLKFFRAG